jgi:hypothetical protein
LPDEPTLRTSPRGVGADTHQSVVTFATPIRCRETRDAGLRLTYPSAVAPLPSMLEHDWKQAGWSVGRAARGLGISIREYRELEAGTRFPNWETYERI